MTVEDLKKQYENLCHAMQTGVAYKINIDASETSPKHLRVGVNSALVETSALVKLLIDKGLISEQDFWELMVSMMQSEVNLYQDFLSAHLGSEVRLH